VLTCGSCGAQSSPTAKFCGECGTRLTQATQSAEYKQVTVLFADVVHSMDIAAADEQNGQECASRCAGHRWIDMNAPNRLPKLYTRARFPSSAPSLLHVRTPHFGAFAAWAVLVHAVPVAAFRLGDAVPVGPRQQFR
jgi:zinc-ribbon domain